MSDPYSKTLDMAAVLLSKAPNLGPCVLPRACAIGGGAGDAKAPSGLGPERSVVAGLWRLCGPEARGSLEALVARRAGGEQVLCVTPRVDLERRVIDCASAAVCTRLEADLRAPPGVFVAMQLEAGDDAEASEPHVEHFLNANGYAAGAALGPPSARRLAVQQVYTLAYALQTLLDNDRSSGWTVRIGAAELAPGAPPADGGAAAVEALAALLDGPAAAGAGKGGKAKKGKAGGGTDAAAAAAAAGEPVAKRKRARKRKSAYVGGEEAR